jgi:hypothetical protein
MKPAPVTRRALGRQHRHAQQQDLLPQRQFHVAGLRDEQRSQRHVDVGAIEVEAVAGGHDQPDHGLAATGALHLLDQRRQRAFRRRGAEHQQQFLAQIGDQAQDREPGQARHHAEHHEDEQQRGDVEGRHQLREVGEAAHAILADGEGHGAERPDRRRLHHDRDQLEHHDRNVFEQVEHALPAIAHRGQGNAEQHRHHQHLQDIALGQRRKERVGIIAPRKPTIVLSCALAA